MRGYSSAAQTVLAGAEPPLVCFLEMFFSTPVRLCTAGGDIDWNGSTWRGIGNVGAVEELRESSGEISGLSFAISGVPSENIALALAESPRGKLCNLYLGVLDPTTQAVVDAQLIFPGVLDQMPIEDEPESSTSTIAVTVVHLGTVLERPKAIRYTDSDQQRLYPGDTSLRFVNSQSQHQDVWPAASFFRR